MQQLGSEWYIDYTADPGNVPPGRKKMLFVPLGSHDDELAAYAQDAPGSVWYMGGEPNRGRMTPARYVEWFDDQVEIIKDADSTAKIAGPSILNWRFTCRGCGGFAYTGEEWMREFIELYRDKHEGAAPPVDIWTMDVYPLTWDDLPMTEWRILTDQMEGFRHFLQTEVPEHADTPIWITELASHWAYRDLAFTEDGKPTIPEDMDWEDDYQWRAMERYMTNLLDWLQDHGPALNIERWFFFASYVDIQDTSLRYGYAGIRFFDSPDVGTPLNRLGRLYREYATGQR